MISQAFARCHFGSFLAASFRDSDAVHFISSHAVCGFGMLCHVTEILDPILLLFVFLLCRIARSCVVRLTLLTRLFFTGSVN